MHKKLQNAPRLCSYFGVSRHGKTAGASWVQINRIIQQVLSIEWESHGHDSFAAEAA